MNNKLRFKNLRYFVSNHGKGRVYTNWTRSTNALICVHKGEIEIKCNKGDVLVKQGECVFVPTKAFGSTYFLSEKNNSFVFLFDFASDAKIEDLVLFKNLRGADTLISDALRAYENGIININYYYSVFYNIIFCIQESQKIEKKYERVHKIALEINRDYNLNLKISDYAKKALMSESSLRALFKEYTGKSIIEYRNDIRIKHAKELILEGMPTWEAALKVGFSSSAYYCRIVSKKRKPL